MSFMASSRSLHSEMARRVFGRDFHATRPHEVGAGDNYMVEIRAFRTTTPNERGVRFDAVANVEFSRAATREVFAIRNGDVMLGQIDVVIAGLDVVARPFRNVVLDFLDAQGAWQPSNSAHEHRGARLGSCRDHRGS